MKKLFIFFFSVIIFSCAYSQPLPDSIIIGYQAAPSSEAKGEYLYNYLLNVVSEQNNMLNKALEISSYFDKQKDEVAIDYTQLYIASLLNRQGDYNTGLNMALPILAKFEKRKDWFGIISSLNIISGCYTLARNYDQAIAYMKRRIPIAVTQHEEGWLTDTYNNLGSHYAQTSMPDSGIIYAQKAVNIDTKNNNVANLVFSLSTLAENYMAKKEFDLALPFLRKAEL